MKSRPKNPGSGKLTKRDRLLAELGSAAKDIDEEGLVFLIEQANVLVHNARVRELEAKRASEPDTSGTAATRSRGRRQAATVAIEPSPDGKSFFLVLGDVRKSLARSELNAILKICALSPDIPEAARRLYAHFGRERRDILTDAGIMDSASPLLAAVAEHARAHGVSKGGPK